VWKNRDPALEGQLRATYEGKAASELRKTHVQVGGGVPILETAPQLLRLLGLSPRACLVSGFVVCCLLLT
jgi:hypothetical protein